MKFTEFARPIAAAIVIFFAGAPFAQAQDAPANSDLIPSSAPANEPALSDEEAKYMAWAKETWDSLDRQTGKIIIAAAHATLDVPENFYYLNPKDAEKILVEVWGNPPGQQTLGMLFPAGLTPFDSNAWAVTIEYEEDGYVSDEDAKDMDFSDLLKTMKTDVRESNKERIAEGYEAIELVGWASQPYYDASNHKLHWAKEIKFGDSEENTLNYNIRILGRKGVLVLNFIASIDQKAVIEDNLPSVLALAQFDSGAQYSDFQPGLDKVAAYGIGALIAGKVIAKTGFFVMALLLLKKFGIFIVVGISALLKMLYHKKS